MAASREIQRTKVMIVSKDDRVRMLTKLCVMSGMMAGLSSDAIFENPITGFDIVDPSLEQNFRGLHSIITTPNADVPWAEFFKRFRIIIPVELYAVRDKVFLGTVVSGPQRGHVADLTAVVAQFYWKAQPGKCRVCRKAASSFCAKCRSASYCSKKCQVADFFAHKLFCPAKADEAKQSLPAVIDASAAGSADPYDGLHQGILQLPEDNKAQPSGKRGAFIVLEGLDRSGKTTQARLLSRLDGVVSIQYPRRDTPIGKLIDAYLKGGATMSKEAVHLLFSANRWEADARVRAHLMAGRTVICDRYSFSGVAFSAANGLDRDWCLAPERGLVAPDAVIFLDISVEDAQKRGGYGTERFEKADIQARVRDQYKILAHDTWTSFSATDEPDALHQRIAAHVRSVIGRSADTLIKTL
jgi:dTMP kinase